MVCRLIHYSPGVWTDFLLADFSPLDGAISSVAWLPCTIYLFGNVPLFKSRCPRTASCHIGHSGDHSITEVKQCWARI
jgi:hypothetical protein